LGKLFVFLEGHANPAYAMNLLSAASGVAAVIACAWLATVLTGRALAGFWSAVLFAGSYTFWSQSIIAEVYSLEALFIALVLIAAVSWWRTPTAGHLAALYGIYALSLGNHLSMILLAPALIWLLWSGRRRATLNPFGVRGIALAIGIAGAGALQYGWNFSGLWALSTPRPGLGELLSTFWFDVTKSDWRATLVGTVPVAQWGNRMAMYWWDLQQQFGLLGIAIALTGLVAMLRAVPAIGIAMALAYFVTFAFAFIYNVGDTHVFLLPSHQIVATCAAFGASLLFGAARGRALGAIATIALLALPTWRIADTWPAVDRSADHRADEYARASIAGIVPGRAVYVADLNWQTQNAVGYHLIVSRPEVPRVFAAQVLWHFPEFVRRNQELGREIIVTKPAADTIASAYGALFPLHPDTRELARPLKTAATIPPGTPYVLVVMTPLPELTYDAGSVAAATQRLARTSLPRARYTMIAGLSGSPPVLNRSGNRPFRETTTLSGHRFDIRIESWLPADTMRRAGFGHVIVDRHHALTLERGANLGIFDGEGQLRDQANEGGSFTVQPRLVIPVLR
jgi:hypothetical protein